MPSVLFFSAPEPFSNYPNELKSVSNVPKFVPPTICASLFQIEYMIYGFGVNFQKDASGVVPFLIWVSIKLCVAVLHIRPSMLQYLQLCSNVNMLHMFLGQKSVRITMVLSILYF